MTVAMPFFTTVLRELGRDLKTPFAKDKVLVEICPSFELKKSDRETVLTFEIASKELIEVSHDRAGSVAQVTVYKAVGSQLQLFSETAMPFEPKAVAKLVSDRISLAQICR